MTVKANPKLEKLLNSQKGKRIVVIGNGPSLLRQDLSGLPECLTIGVNRAYRLPAHNRTVPSDWVPTYACWNDHQLTVMGSDPFAPEEYQDSLACFVADRGLKGFAWQNLVPFKIVPPVDLAVRAVRRGEYRGIVGGLSSCVSAVHLAFCLGAKTVDVIGVDHEYDSIGRVYFYSQPDGDKAHEAGSADPHWRDMAEAWKALASLWPKNSVRSGAPKDVLGLPGYKRVNRFPLLPTTATSGRKPLKAKANGGMVAIDINPDTTYDEGNEVIEGGWIKIERGRPVSVTTVQAEYLCKLKNRDGVCKYVRVGG